MSTTPFIAFSPINGVALPLPLTLTLADARVRWAAVPWVYNPWTGNKRDSRDMASDPWGRAMVFSTKDMKAATLTLEECACFPGECRQQVNTEGRTPAGYLCKWYNGWNSDHVPTPNEASGEDWPLDDAARAAMAPFTVPGYETLSAVLIRAYEQAACGKGRDRHASGAPFLHQPMQTIEALVGGGFCAGQAIKKIQESGRMDRDAAVRELLGAIVYIAGNIIALERAGVSKPAS